jgi:hypothetical protein
MANSEMNADWRDLYRQAVFEFDSEKFEMRIEAANQAIRCRVCAMWQLGPVDARERSQLDAASYFLGLLRMAGKKKPSSTAAHSILAPDQHSA